MRVEAANKAIAAKAAKLAGDGLGLAIAILQGKAKLVAAKVRHGFKVVTRNEAGDLVSVWDGSSWALGKRRGEAATANHTGGFYYYRTAEQALQAARANEIFKPHMHNQLLVLVEVEASGAEYELSNNKLCVTYLKPVAIHSESIT